MSDTDWREAGRKADAHRVRDLYRGVFLAGPKDVARIRVADVLRAAGVQTVLDLWGGGVSSEQFVRAGFRVLSVENGSMTIGDRGVPVTAIRKRRALEYAAREGGYEARWGNVGRFAHEADGAFLDFCGPWSRETRRAVEACRHMKAICVTLTGAHDTESGATSATERYLAYEAFLLLASGFRRTERLEYRNPVGLRVWVYLLDRRNGIRPLRPPRPASRFPWNIKAKMARAEWRTRQAAVQGRS